MLELQIIISFVVGGLVIALQTLFGERVPLRWRGVVLTIPSTMALGLFFIGLTKTPVDAAQAAVVVEAALGLGYLFVIAFTLFSRFGLWASFFGSFAFWTAGAAGVLFYPPASLTHAILFYALPVAVVGYLVTGTMEQVHEIKPVPINTKHLTFRALFCGSIIVAAVVLSKTAGNVWGGLFATFPAVFSSTFLIYYAVHGKKIIPSVAKSTFFPGAIGFTLYASMVALTFPKYGIWVGTLLAYVVVIPFYILYTLLKSQFSKS